MVRFPTWAGILVLGLALSFGSASAFTAPTVSPGVGGGSLQLDASGNLGIGTSSSTPIGTFNSTSTESGPTTHGRVFMVASSTNPGVGLKNLTSGNTYLWSARNFGNLQLYRESGSYPGLVVIDINQFGDVSIGTSTPSAGSASRLTVNGTTTISGNLVANAVNATLTGNVPASGVTTGVFSSGNFAFQNALGIGTTSLVGLPTNGLVVTGTTTLATTAGNVGIGTLSPTRKLDVAGAIRISAGQFYSGSSIGFFTDASGAQVGSFGGLLIGTSYDTTPVVNQIRTTANQNLNINARGTGYLSFSTADVEKMRILNNGNVGIGTTTPISPLHVLGSTTITDDVYLSDNKSIRLDSAAATTLLIGNYNSGSFTYGSGAGVASLAVEGDVKGNRLCFGDSDCQTSWSGIVASGGGNYWVNSGSNVYPSSTSWKVGVGTTTPPALFTSVGSGSIAGSNLANSWILAGNTSAGVGIDNNEIVSGSGSGDLNIGTIGSNGIVFKPNNSAALYLSSGGVVGVGTTTFSGSYKFVVSDGTSGVTPLQRIENYSTGDAAMTFAIAGAQAYSIGIDNSDSDKFKIGGNSGDVGLSNFLTIDSSGNVGIGTTTPATELHVISASGNAATFNQPITIGYPVASTDAARKDYVDAAVLAATSSQYWTLNGSNLYPNSTSYNVGIGTTAPVTKLDVNGTETTNRISQGASGSTYTELATRSWGGNNAIFFGAYATSSYINGDFLTAGNTRHKYASSSFGASDHRAKALIGDHLGIGFYISGISPGADQSVTWNQEFYVSPSNIYIPTNNVGVGESAPGSKLSVSGNATIGANYDTTAAPTNGLLVEGNVGIGTTTPVTKLHVVTGSGNAATFNQPITIGYPVASTDAARKDYVDAAVLAATSSQYWTLNGSNLYPNSTSYNVGIGTTTPATNLYVYSDGSTNGNFRMGDQDISTPFSGIISPAIAAPDWFTIGMNSGTIGGAQLNSYTDADGVASMSFNAHLGTTTPTSPAITLSGWKSDGGTGRTALTGTERILDIRTGTTVNATFLASGNVGIGTTTPPGLLTGYTNNWNSTTYPFQFINTDGGGADGNTVLIKGGSLSVNSRMLEVQDYSGNTEFYINGNGVANFSNPVTIGYPVASTDAARKDYVDAAVLAATSSQYWTLNGSNLYPNSTSYNVGIGTTTPAQVLHVYKDQDADTRIQIQNTNSGTSARALLSLFNDGSAGGHVLVGGVGYTGVASWQDSMVISADSGLSGGLKLRASTGGIKLSASGTETNDFYINSSGNVGIGTNVPGANLEIGTTTASANVIGRVLTSDSYNAGLEAYGASQGTGYLYVGQASNYGGGIFYNGDANPAFATGEAADRVSFFRKNSNANEVVFSYSYVSNVVDFRDRITIGYPTASTDAARKDYVDANFAPIGGTSGVWRLSGSSVYPSSTSYNVGIGLTNPAAPLNVYATTSLATSTETIRLSAPQNYTAGFGPKLSFWNGTSEQLALITGSIQNTSNGNFGRLDFGTRTSDALGVQTKMSILADGSVGVGTTTPANRLAVVGGNISIQPSQVIGSGLTFDSPGSAASSSIELYNAATGDLTIRTGYVNGDILLLPRANVGIGTTTPATKLHVVTGSGNAATFSSPITIGYPVASTDAARKDYVDAAIAAGTSTSANSCNGDATCEITNADFGGTGNITGVNKLTVTTIDPLYEIKGKKYSTYASAIAGGVKEEYVGRGEMKKSGSGKWQMVLDFDSIKDGSDLWVWKNTVDFSEDNIEVLVTPIGSPVPMAYEVKNNKIIFSAQSKDVSSLNISFSYRLVGKRVDWKEWPTFAKDQSEKPSLIIK